MNRDVRGFTLSIIALLLELVALITLFSTDFRNGAGSSEGVLIMILGILSLVASTVALVDFKKTNGKTSLKTAGLPLAIVALLGGAVMGVIGLGLGGYFEM